MNKKEQKVYDTLFKKHKELILEYADLENVNSLLNKESQDKSNKLIYYSNVLSTKERLIKVWKNRAKELFKMIGTITELSSSIYDEKGS